MRIMDAQHAAAKQKLCLHPLESQAQGRFWYQPVVLDGAIGIVELFERNNVLSLQKHINSLTDNAHLKTFVFPLIKVKMVFEWGL